MKLSRERVVSLLRLAQFAQMDAEVFHYTRSKQEGTRDWVQRAENDKQWKRARRWRRYLERQLERMDADDASAEV